jgi:hypothetical protein
MHDSKNMYLAISKNAMQYLFSKFDGDVMFELPWVLEQTRVWSV